MMAIYGEHDPRCARSLTIDGNVPQNGDALLIQIAKISRPWQWECGASI
jgi:hypothetical protein